jgi:hypothetical protein
MIRTLLVGATLAIAVTAHAFLGDTYDQCCKTYGKHIDPRAYPYLENAYKDHDWPDKPLLPWFLWHSPLDNSTSVKESFQQDRSVAFQFFPGPDKRLSPRDVERFLQQNGQGRTWVCLPIPEFGSSDREACWKTVDGVLLAAVYTNGTFKVANSEWFRNDGKDKDFSTDQDDGIHVSKVLSHAVKWIGDQLNKVKW